MIGFGNYGKKRDGEILLLSDKRLVKIDTSVDGFYNKVLNYQTSNQSIQDFCEAICEVREVGVTPFYKPVMDPSFIEQRIIYKEGSTPAIGHSLEWWKNKTEEMPNVGKMRWKIGSEYQYYAFLVYLINYLSEFIGIQKAIEKVVIDSKELGHYANSENAKDTLELTGSRKQCGCCDLANTFKILSCTNGEGFWLAGGHYYNYGYQCPLADLVRHKEVNSDTYKCVAWLVLE